MLCDESTLENYFKKYLHFDYTQKKMSNNNNNNNNESKYGFKDKEKALETLTILESHDMQYRKLTVRGLLRRAKRVLSLTKADDKIKNINEAIQIFENWLKENCTESSKPKVADGQDDKVETVPGLGFKNKEAAEQTLMILKDRDPEYQKCAVKGLILNSKRVLASCNCEEKIQNLKEGVQVLEDFLVKFETENMMANNRIYLSIEIINKFPKPQTPVQLEFIEAYGGAKAKGNYKHLRTMHPENVGDTTTTWDIIRNRNIEELLKQIKADDVKLFDDHTGEPTEHHMKLIYWAYSPATDKLKAYIAANEKDEARKAEKRKIEETDESKNLEEAETNNNGIPEKKAKLS